ncbi:MAG: DUF983 domain-containing protein [Acetobacteraceae bacterium]|nr:DUF983 domain-containing protein [Acetobacteraceae bacterium]
MPPPGLALKRKLLRQCPSCGQTKLFQGYLRVVCECAGCGAPRGSKRADDAPPYFTIFIIGHIVVPLLLMVEQHATLSILAMSLIFLPLSLILTLAPLHPVTSATVGAMVTLGMVQHEPRDGRDDD